MSVSVEKSIYYRSRIFDAGFIANAFLALAKTFRADAVYEATIFRENADGSRSTDDTKYGLQQLCDLRNPPSHVLARFGKSDPSYLEGASISLAGHRDFYIVRYNVKDAAQLGTLVTEVEQKLGLTPVPQEEVDAQFEDEWAAIEELRRRVASLERAAAEHKPTIFLSYRFDDNGRNCALHVRRLLELLQVKVITGESYEPRTIQEKVKTRLEGLDAIVVIVTKGPASSWIRDELNRSNTRVIPLVEEGAKFDKGLFGDIEYISFAPGHVADAFIRLIEGVAYLSRSPLPKAQDKK